MGRRRTGETGQDGLWGQSGLFDLTVAAPKPLPVKLPAGQLPAEVDQLPGQTDILGQLAEVGQL